MKRVVKPALLGITLIVFLCGLSGASDNQVVGKWASDTRSKGGLGTRYNFTNDGVVMISFGALVDFDYRIEGQILKTNLKGDTVEKPDSIPFEIVGDKLIINPSDTNSRQEMTRTSIPDVKAPPIVGVWSFKHYTGVMATMRYATSGLAQLSVPFACLKGRYELQGQELIIEFEGNPSVKRKIRLEGNRLIFLADGEKKQEEYTRVLP
jgi:hypothetical protein